MPYGEPDICGAGGTPSPNRSSKPMIRFILRRLAVSVLTLFLLSVMVFFGGQILPGNVGRAILGPFADQRAVETLNHSLGLDRPYLVQYWDWISHFVQGDMGMSYVFRSPVAPF